MACTWTSFPDFSESTSFGSMGLLGHYIVYAWNSSDMRVIAFDLHTQTWHNCKEENTALPALFASPGSEIGVYQGAAVTYTNPYLHKLPIAQDLIEELADQLVDAPPETDSNTSRNVFFSFGGRNAADRVDVMAMCVLERNRLLWKVLPTKGSVPSKRVGATLSQLDDSTLLMYGGYSGKTEETLYSFDIKTLTWEQIIYRGSISELRYHAGSIIGGLLYIFGGRAESDNDQNTLYIFDPSSGEVQTIKAPTEKEAVWPSPRCWPQMCTMHDRFLLSFGASSTEEQVWVYDTVLNEWQSLEGNPVTSGLSIVSDGRNTVYLLDTSGKLHQIDFDLLHSTFNTDMASIFDAQLRS